MVHNQKRFSTLDYKENKVTDETRSVWLPINSQLREEAVYKVQLMDLYLQDNNQYQLSGLTEEVSRIFSSKYQLSRPYEFPDRVHLQVTFEFDLNLYRIDRDVYSLFDWIGDLGGLLEGLSIIMAFILSLLHYRQFEHYMIEKLYSKKKGVGDVDDNQKPTGGGPDDPGMP